MNIGIVGLGLIGGSMAKSLSSRTAHTVFGIDINAETMMLARLCGAIEGELNDDTLKGCDMVIVALRPHTAVEWVKAHAPLIRRESLVIDLCGVKRTVCAAIAPIAAEYGFSYIGGHPMAGKERGRFINSTDSLFDGASMILTPFGDVDATLPGRLDSFFTDIGFARVVYTIPEEHDRIIAYTSQLAHIVSNAYVRSPDAQRQRGFSAGSFMDLTRVAYLDEDMWTELFLDNADFLTEQLEIFTENLAEYLDALRDRDAERLRDLLRDGREKKSLAGGS